MDELYIAGLECLLFPEDCGPSRLGEKGKGVLSEGGLRLKRDQSEVDV